MQKLIGGIAAFVAIAAGILCGVEPVTVVFRSALAFILGSLATQLWYVFFTVRVHTLANEQDEEYITDRPDEVPPAQAA
jgi:hypothetical protein